MLLLPDGWYHNGYTNISTLEERMKFLQDISDIFIKGKRSIEFYLGLSGTRPEDYFDITVKNKDLIKYLTDTLSIDGAENGFHISVVP